MRRMYSKEQLQKLIDEGSRLIAIEELDKVVPVPSVAKAGYYMAVNSAGTGYELVPSPDSTHLYCHPCTILTEITSGEYAGRKYYLTCLIFNNSATAFTLGTFQSYINDLCSNYNAKIMTSGALYEPISQKTTIATAMIWNGEQVVIQGLESGSNNINSFGLMTLNTDNTTFTDGVNQIL